MPSCSNRHVTFDSNPIKCALPGITPVQYNKGDQHLTAYDALDFVRCRDGLPYTDYDRQRHQQQFIKALMQEAYDKGITDPTKLNGFLKSIGKAFTFDRRRRAALRLDLHAQGLSPNSMVTIKTNDGQYAHYTGPAPDARQALTADSLLLSQDVIHDKVDTVHRDASGLGSELTSVSRRIHEPDVRAPLRTVGEVVQIAHWTGGSRWSAGRGARAKPPEPRYGRRSADRVGLVLIWCSLGLLGGGEAAHRPIRGRAAPGTICWRRAPAGRRPDVARRPAELPADRLGRACEQSGHGRPIGHDHHRAHPGVAGSRVLDLDTA